jgi:Rad3-related DNA helicase
VIIFDEAHNMERACTDATSYDLRSTLTLAPALALALALALAIALALP